MREVRKLNNITTGTDNRNVSGYALVFDSESVDLGGFYEIIERSAMDGVIEKSDVLCVLNHNTDKGVLARSNKGEGSLKLTVDEHGLKYEFTAPQTALGDELLEGIRRGDISTSSFAFVCEKDEWIKRADGTVLRRIKKIKQIYDVSPVYVPAYTETEVVVDNRGLKELIERENNPDNNIIPMKRSHDEILEQIKALMNELQDDNKEAVVEENSDEIKDEENKVEQQETTETEVEQVEEAEAEANEETEDQAEGETETDETEEIEDENNKENRNKSNTSMKKFSLLETINDVINNRSMNEAAIALNKEGRSAMAKAGLAANGNITLPVAELRDDPTAVNGILATVPTQGKENVATEKLNILEPLRAAMVLSKAGATYMTGLVGDISIPVYSGSNCGWKGEVVAADKGEGKFSEVILKPRRLTCFVDVSRQFLLQDSNDAEEMLKRDIINAIGEKLEQTILGAEAGTADKPAGVFNGVAADTAAFKFDNIVDMEADLDEANISGELTYIVSPKAKAILRKTSKDNGSGRFVMEDGEIEGTKVLCSSAVANKGVIVGDFRDYVVAQWGGLDLVVDNITKAADGMVRLVINAYFDAVPRRANAFVKRILK